MALSDKLGVQPTLRDAFPQAATVAAAKVDYTTGDLDAEAEIIAATNATNTKLNSVIAALKAVK